MGRSTHTYIHHTYFTYIFEHTHTNVSHEAKQEEEGGKKSEQTVEELVGKLRTDLRLSGLTQFQTELIRKDGCHMVYAPSHRDIAVDFWVTYKHVTYIL